MHYIDKMSKSSDIFCRLQDKESKIVFEARVNYLISRNENEFYKEINKLKKECYCTELNDFLKDNEDYEGIIIFGTDKDSIRTKELLESCNKSVRFFCDKNLLNVGKTIEGLTVISMEELVKAYSKCIVILSSKPNLTEAYCYLLRSGFPRKQILFPMHKQLITANGWQYFDVFKPVDREIYIDAGAYNGDSILDFVKWTGGAYERIYAFEANPEMADTVRKTIAREKLENVIITPKAVWSKEKLMAFVKNDAASKIEKSGKIKIQTVDIDSVVGDDKVTFIKMDVEGSELQALKGAIKTIRSNRPRLAISIYHTPEDIIELPAYLLEILPDYKFYMRHYNSNMWETVLYAY